MICPEYLKQGDKIGIVAPARFIEQNKYSEIISIIENSGYVPVRGKTTYLEHGTFAGTDKERQQDIQEMLDDNSIKAIFCLRGGYGTIRIIDQINFDHFINNPKWVIGFSDITILHTTIHNISIESIHGQMPLNFVGRSENKGLIKLFETLEGKTLNYSIPSHSLNRCGNAEGILVGGNVAILSSLIGTPYDINTDGKILFVEEVGEYLYRLDRLMHHLKMSGKLARLKGLIVGGLTDMTDGNPSFINSAEEIIKHLVDDYDYPVCFNFPAGHIKENYPLIFGRDIKLNLEQLEVKIEF